MQITVLGGELWTDPSTTVYLAERPPETGRETHEEHVEGVAQIDDSTAATVCSCYLRNGCEDGGRGDWGQERAKRQQSYNDGLA